LKYFHWFLLVPPEEQALDQSLWATDFLGMLLIPGAMVHQQKPQEGSSGMSSVTGELDLEIDFSFKY